MWGFFALAFVVTLKENAESLQSFSISFSKPKNWSKEEFVEFKGVIPELKEFTSCHWQKDMYFPEGFSPIWNFCSAETKDNDGFKCFGAYTKGIVSTANRHIQFGGWFEGWPNENMDMVVDINLYRHRQWNHYCWSYSSLTGKNKFYYNGKLVGELNLQQKYLNSNPPIPKGSNEANFSAFIIGQDQDGIKEYYSPLQALYGSIAELNLWDKVQDQSNIAMMASCKHILKGNIVSWKKENFASDKVAFTDVEDIKDFCKEAKEYIVFPERYSSAQAMSKCATISGNMVAPESEEENAKVHNILLKHKENCLEKIESSSVFNYGKSIWLGVVKRKEKWFKLNYNVKQMYTKQNYTNWGKEYKFAYKMEDGCAYMTPEGKWGFSDWNVCRQLRLCAICSVTQTPVFTLKGLCAKGSTLEWNYYPLLSKTHQIESLDGYKNRAIMSISNDRTWRIQTEDARIQINYTVGYPIGRLTWDWYDNTCGVSVYQRRLLTFSTCEIGTQFTCNSGRCISISQRCDTQHDCNDGEETSSHDDWSDEENCEIISFPPNSYKKILPPPLIIDEPDGRLSATDLRTKVLIESVDLVDTVAMRIGVTMQIRMRWRDSRLQFKDVFPSEKKVLDKKTATRLWIPLDHVIHSNAIIGKIWPEKNRQIFVNVMSNASDMSHSLNEAFRLIPYATHEHLSYDGPSSELEVRQRFRILYKCTYQLLNYPFDEQRCHLEMKIKALNGRNVTFQKDFPGVLQIGEELIKQFKIVNMNSSTHQKNGKNFNGSISVFIIEISMVRNYYDQIQMIFVPTFLLWFVAYMTLYVSLEDFGNRCKIAVSILLILVSLLGASRNDFPKTTYFKFIDLWFFWYIVNIFLIILHHILLENIDRNRHDWNTFTNKHFHKKENGAKKTVEPYLTRRCITKKCLNIIAKVLFLITNLLFTVFYMCFSYLHTNGHHHG